jgi:hypothetical protein
MFLDQYSSCYFVITAVLQQHVLNPCIIITTEKCIKHLDAVIFKSYLNTCHTSTLF